VSLLLTYVEVSTRPSATKRGYMISHSDLSKPAAENEPSGVVGVAKARSISTFILPDLFHGALDGAVLRHRVFLVPQMDESSKWDFRSSREASIAGLRELEASALNTTYTLTAISFASGQLSNKSLSEPPRRRIDGEPQARLKNNEFNKSSVSLDETSTTPALGFVTAKCGKEACAGLDSCKACAWKPKLIVIKM
jgi:hypothetical protein